MHDVLYVHDEKARSSVYVYKHTPLANISQGRMYVVHVLCIGITSVWRMQAIRLMPPRVEGWVWFSDFHGFGMRDLSPSIGSAFLGAL